MQSSSLSRNPDSNAKPQAAEEPKEISRQNRDEAPAAEQKTDPHAEGSCCGGCGG